MKPLISVVMAAKNYARFLPTAVDSVFAQTIADWELVIIDDGSTDETPAAVRPYLRDPRVRYVRSDRLGQSRAKNLGERLSRGGFIAYLDADDAWLPTKLEKQLAVFAEHPECGVVFTARELIDDAGRTIAPNAQQTTTAFPRGHVFEQIFLKNFVCFSSAMVKKQVFDRVGGFDPNLDLAIDYDLWLRVARHYDFHGLAEPLTRYRTGHGNLSGKLIDRVRTAEVIMNRAIARNPNALCSETIGEGYASTFRAAAFTLRRKETRQSLRWSLRAILAGGKRREALRGLLGTLVRLKREVSTGENAAYNR